ncbi:CocE/NonD family hydrolase C-terminal non-catalytic domain-containing protein [Streptomyces sp. NPDC093984]|uniref:S15 peptidase family protein n=1 Tax=Streptomyces sp. NPDC093984 TaxID=3366052 RepID=UPI0038276ABD
MAFGRRRFLAVLSTTAAVLGLASPSAERAAAATVCPLALSVSAQVSPPGGSPYTVCSGVVPSFDGTPLDVDVSLPQDSSGPLPLMVMLNGWGHDKTDFESTTPAGNGANTYHWNNAWFTGKGFAVLNFTSRGFHRSCGKDPATGYTYATDPACAGRADWTHLADRRWEVHDTQFLAGLLVDAGVAAPDKVVTTGDSYGGGQSWLLALSQDKVMTPDGTSVPWTSPKGVPLHLAAAVPQYAWTDLAQALIDNGRGSDGLSGAPGDGPHEDPVGVAKESYLDGLYALGTEYGQYAADDPTADIPGWHARITAGEPYGKDPLINQIVRQLADYRSPYDMPVPPASVRIPVLSIQGTTDPLFPAVHTAQMVNRLQAAAPGYPVWTFYGDLGHSYADNPHQVWAAANDEANDWLDAVLAGSQPTTARTTLSTTACMPGQTNATLTADRFSRLANGSWTFTGSTGAVTTSSIPDGTEAAAVDPIANSGCRTTPAQSDRGVASWVFDPPSPGIITGSPVVHVTATPQGADAELAARLFDIDPASGTQTLITRSVYRVTGSPGNVQPLAFELWPAGWQLQSGHRLRLELTQSDAPTWRPDNETSSLTLSPPVLTVPVRTS